MSELLDWAITYAERGWPVFPSSRKKVPLTAHGFKDATTDLKQIERWWGKEFPDANVSLSVGPVGLAVVDIDAPNGERALLELDANKGVRFQGTLTSLTGRGRHLFFRRLVPMKNSTGVLGPGLDIKTTGGSVTLPPSLHANGKRYEWVDFDAQIARFPMSALLVLNPPRPTYPMQQITLQKITERIRKAPRGQRNAELNKACYTAGGLIGNGTITEQEATAALDAAGAEVGLSVHERRATIASGLKAGITRPLEKRT